ncbi:hypothetical protein BASA81_006818 [Batrachochytrium salamandrivorans]|nr:hypothetical protein BASA81_006818 [Batrachochytrium salamandrivorans]
MPAPSAAEQRDIFDMFDSNHDGVVTKDEFGTMTWDQFAANISSKLSGGSFTTEQIVEMFKVFDKDGDGHVSANEIRSVMAGVYGEPLSEAEIEEVIKLADVDGDGQINYTEFVRLVLNESS